MTRPVDEADVVVNVDGQRVAPVDLPIARAFLGDWKVAAHPVVGVGTQAYVSRDAVLLELLSEQSDDGRAVAVAAWLSNAVAVSRSLADVDSFARSAGRTLDMEAAARVLDAALSAQHSLPAARGRFLGGSGRIFRFLRWILGLLRGRR